MLVNKKLFVSVQLANRSCKCYEGVKVMVEREEATAEATALGAASLSSHAGKGEGVSCFDVHGAAVEKVVALGEVVGVF